MVLLFDETTRTTELSVSESTRSVTAPRAPAVTAAAGGAALLRVLRRARTKLGRRTRVRRGVAVGLLVDPGMRFDPRLAPLTTSAGATDLGLLLPAPWLSVVVVVDRPSDTRPILAYAVRATTVGPNGPGFFKRGSTMVWAGSHPPGSVVRVASSNSRAMATLHRGEG